MTSPAKRVVSSISALSFNGDGTRCALSPNNNHIKIFDTKSWKLLFTLTEHTGIVKYIDWAPNTNRILTCSQDRNAYVWNKVGNTWKPTLVLLRINRAATCCTWAPGEQKFAVGSGDKTLSVCHYDKANDWWAAKHIRKPHKATILATAWHPDGMRLASSCSDGKVRVFSGYLKKVDEKYKHKTGAILNDIEGGTRGFIHDCAFSPEGLTFAYCGHDSSISFATFNEDETLGKPQRIKTKSLPFTRIIFITEEILFGIGHDYVPYVFAWDSAASKWVNKGTMQPLNKLDTISSHHQGSVVALAPIRDSKGKIKAIGTGGTGGFIVQWPISKITALATKSA